MALPRPFPGLVVRYAYLWADEARVGQEAGRKDRPCVIVVAATRQQDGRVQVRVLPMTHTEPAAGRGIPVPARVKRHLGLDDSASWIILDESNVFIWPGPDLRPIGRTRPGVWSYGALPVELFADIQSGLRSLVAARAVRRND